MRRMRRRIFNINDLNNDNCMKGDHDHDNDDDDLENGAFPISSFPAKP